MGLLLPVLHDRRRVTEPFEGRDGAAEQIGGGHAGQLRQASDGM